MMSDRRAKRARMSATVAKHVDFDDQGSFDEDEDSVWYRGRRVDLSSMPPAERRRFKNRVSAAKSRDRKKEQVSRLEDRLRAMEAENRRLRDELEELRAIHSACGRSGHRGDDYGSETGSTRSPDSVVSRSPSMSSSRASSHVAMPIAMPSGFAHDEGVPMSARHAVVTPRRRPLSCTPSAPETSLFGGEVPMAGEPSARSGRIA